MSCFCFFFIFFHYWFDSEFVWFFFFIFCGLTVLVFSYVRFFCLFQCFILRSKWIASTADVFFHLFSVIFIYFHVRRLSLSVVKRNSIIFSLIFFRMSIYHFSVCLLIYNKHCNKIHIRHAAQHNYWPTTNSSNNRKVISKFERFQRFIFHFIARVFLFVNIIISPEFFPFFFLLKYKILLFFLKNLLIIIYFCCKSDDEPRR